MTLQELVARAICNASYGEDIADHPEYEEPHGKMVPSPTGRKLWQAFLPEADAALAAIEAAQEEQIRAVVVQERERCVMATELYWKKIAAAIRKEPGA